MNNAQIEKLDNSNYDSWKILMKSILVQNDQWNVASGATKRTDENGTKFDLVDQKALASITLCVSKAQLIHIKNSRTAHECWEKLKKVHSRMGPSRKVTLFKSLIHARASDDKPISDYLDNFSDIVEKLTELGIEIQDEVLCIILLCSLPATYENFVIAIESRDTLPTFDNVKSKIAEESLRRDSNKNDQVPGENAENSAFYTHQKQNNPKPNFRKTKIKCYNCGKFGHKSFQCQKGDDKSKTSDEKSKTKNKQKKAFGAMNPLQDKSSQNEWFVDSGATNHMTPHAALLKQIKKSDISKINVANNEMLQVEGTGIAEIEHGGHTIEVKNVLLVPNLTGNLLSVSEMVKNKNTVIFDNQGCTVFDADNEIVAKAKENNGIYAIQNKSASCFLTNDNTKCEIVKWHRRLGHLNFNDMCRMKNGITDGMNFTGKNDALVECQVCSEGKQHRSPFKSSGERKEKFLQLIHSDVCGPMEVRSFGQCYYFVTFIDDHSRKVFIYLMKQKSEVIQKFKEFKNMVENQVDSKIKIIRSDNGMEYCSAEFDNYCIQNGIVHQRTNVYTPQQNGLAERTNRTIVERAKCMLFDADLPKIYWGEAVNTAVYIINRCLSSVLKDNTPEGVWHNKKVDLSNLRVFGSECMVHIPKEKRRKWDKKSSKLLFMGYSETTKGYRCIDPKTKKITTSRDVIFMENKNLQVIKFNHNNNNDNLIADGAVNVTENEVSILEDTYEDANDITYTPSSEDSDENDGSSSLPDKSSFSEDTPVEVRKSKRIVKPPGRLTYKASAIIEDPLSIEDAKSSENWSKWKLAMKEEFKSLHENNTWELVDLPTNRKAIRNKWVFKTKKDEAGQVARFKARLVVKGFSQRMGIDYNETYSPVVRYSTLRYLVGIAAKLNLDIDQMDAITAFLQSDLSEDIYMVQPEEFDDATGKVCKLNKAIYGLKQASRSWNEKLDRFLLGEGYRKSKLDPCLYIKLNNNKLIIIAVYVDDMLIFSNDKEMKADLKSSLLKNFKMKDLGVATSCVGLRISRDRSAGKIWLDQEPYINEILKRFNMIDCNPISNPLEANQKLTKEMSPKTEEERIEMQNIPYQEAVGSILYLVQGTRPDLTFAISNVSQFNNNPGKAHWQAIKRILRYIKGTSKMKLEYSKDANSKIVGFSDSDWGGCTDDRRSCTGYVYIMNGGAISWASKRQTTVALSSTEAEYMALASATQEAMWFKQLDEDLWRKPSEPIMIHCDNQGALQLAKNDGYHNRTRHIDIKHHFCREKLRDGQILIEHIGTKEMVADSLTKSVTKEKTQFCAREMGLKM